MFMSVCCVEMSEQMRQNDRMIRKTQREVERERTDLERQEKKLVGDNSLLRLHSCLVEISHFRKFGTLHAFSTTLA